MFLISVIGEELYLSTYSIVSVKSGIGEVFYLQNPRCKVSDRRGAISVVTMLSVYNQSFSD